MTKLIRILYLFYQWCIAGPIFVVLTLITAILTAVGSRLGNDAFWGYWPPHYWSKLTCWIFLMKVSVEGREHINKNISYVFVANHQGAFDIWSIYGFLNHKFKWLMKKELEKIPAIGWACKWAGQVFVDDSNIAGIKETIADAEKNLRDGTSLVIFPEGSRSWDGKMIPFKRGAFMLAGEFRLPVVPITINGSFKALPRSTYNMTPAHIRLIIHPPIYPTEKGFNTKQLLQQCTDRIQSALS